MFKRFICRVFGLMPVPKSLFIVLDASDNHNRVVHVTVNEGSAVRVASIDSDYSVKEWTNQ